MNKQFNWEDLPCSCSKNYTCNRCKNLDKKHLIFKFFKDMPKTKVYKVYSAYDDSELGFIRWEGRWRQYIYDTDHNDVIWSWECLEELKDFIIQLNKEQKEKRNVQKV